MYHSIVYMYHYCFILLFFFFFLSLINLSFGFFFFFFNDTATTEIYTLSLHDALPICEVLRQLQVKRGFHLETSHSIVNDVLIALSARSIGATVVTQNERHYRAIESIRAFQDRKSTRLNSSHDQISYAVFCLKKKKKRK